jgi:hypothetical protein
MSNGFRHFLGVIAGLLLPPVIVGLLVFGVDGLTDIGSKVAADQAPSAELYTRFGLLAGAAILIGIMAGSRVSPFASLIGGLLFTAAGSLWIVYPAQVGDLIARFPIENRDQALRTLVYHGIFLLVGVSLLVSSLPLSRWRALIRQLTSPLPNQPYEPQPYNPQQADPRTGAGEAQVSSGTLGGATAERNIDVPGYRFLPRESRSSNQRGSYVIPVGEGTTQEMPRKPFGT